SGVAQRPCCFCGAPPVRYDVVSGEPSRLSRFFQRDLRREDGAWIAKRNQNFCAWKPSENRADVITIGRSFFHPARDRVERAAQGGRVRFDHENQQILLRVRWIECRALKRFKKFLPGKGRIVALAPLARAAEEHVGERLFGEVIKLRPAATRRVFGQDSREISGFLG